METDPNNIILNNIQTSNQNNKNGIKLIYKIIFDSNLNY